MAKNDFLTKMQKRAETEAVRRERLAGMIARQQTLDKVTITLGRMGFTAEEFEEFNHRFCETEMDFCDEVITDGNSDKSMEYAKEKIDRCIRQYVPENLFVPYEERYKW